jgi:hypothetical protein
MKAVPPEIIPTAEKFIGAFCPDGIGEKQGFQRFQHGKGIQYFCQVFFLHIHLDLAGTGKKAKVGVVVKKNFLSIIFIGT